MRCGAVTLGCGRARVGGLRASGQAKEDGGDRGSGRHPQQQQPAGAHPVPLAGSRAAAM